MKKKMKAFTAVLLVSFAGLAAGNGQAAAVEPGKILVAYYSWSGHTKIAAETIQKATGGTLCEIQPADAYPAAYRACTERAKKEIEAGERPPLKERPDLSAYEVVFIGSPNWWSTIAPPIASFLGADGLPGKTVIPFVTHGGGGMAGCEQAVRELCPQANVLMGRAFPGGNIRNLGDAISRWARETITTIVR